MGLKRVTTTTHLFVDGGYIHSGTSLSMNWILVILGELPSFLKRSEQYVPTSTKEFGVRGGEDGAMIPGKPGNFISFSHRCRTVDRRTNPSGIEKRQLESPDSG